MIANKDVCKKNNSLFPEVNCGKDINVNFDPDEMFWIVDLQNNNRHLRTYIDSDDINSCLKSGECIGLGLEISQLLDNIKK